MTYDEAERALRNGTYLSESDERLREMCNACRQVSGPNHQAVDRIRKAGEVLQQELHRRQAARNKAIEGGLITDEAASHAGNNEQEDTVHGDARWNEDRLLSLIRDQIEESLNLEYKAAAALSRDKIAEITKDISAFSNSAGGVLIYGIAEFADEQRAHLPERIDPINRNNISKEWLEQIISQIRPRISDVEITPVKLNSGPVDAAYVVEIPQGNTAHQAKDFRYYRRYNFQSVPMADHEIRDVMNRRVHPCVEIDAEIVFYPKPNSDGKDGVIVFKILNQSDVLARYVALVANVPFRIKGKLVAFDHSVIDQTQNGSCFRVSFSNHIGAPLFPRATLRALFPFRIASQMDPEPSHQQKNITFSVYADSMPKVSGEFSVEEIIRD